MELHDGYFFPRGRRDLLELAPEARGHQPRGAARPASSARLVLSMPFVRMVALSGSLAHLNADGEADLDLFVITRGGRVWGVTTTLLALSRLCGWRRRLCLNYVISERQLTVEPRDLFSANQIVHLRPLSGGDLYRRFLDANRFVAHFYPNFTPRPLASDGGAKAPPLRMHWPFGARSGGASAPPSTVADAARAAVEWLLDHTLAPLYERACRAAYRGISIGGAYVAVARSGPPRTRMPQAPHQQPSSNRDGSIRAGAGQGGTR